MAGNIDGDNSTHLLYGGKEGPNKFQDHINEIAQQLKNVMSKGESGHVIATNTTHSKYLVMAIMLLQRKRINILTIQHYECERDCLVDEAILINSKMSTWMNISKGISLRKEKINREERSRCLTDLVKNHVGTCFKEISKTSRVIVARGEDYTHQCPVCSKIKPDAGALSKHVTLFHTRSNDEFKDEEIIKKIRLYDTMRYEEKVKKMTDSELAEFRAKQSAYGKKWREEKTEEERVAKIKRDSKMRAERHKAMTEEERSEYNRKVRERNQKKREEVATKLETLPKDSSEYKQLLEAERVKKEKKAEDHRQRKRKAKEMAASMVLLCEDDEAKLEHDREMEEKKEKKGNGIKPPTKEE